MVGKMVCMRDVSRRDSVTELSFNKDYWKASCKVTIMKFESKFVLTSSRMVERARWRLSTASQLLGFTPARSFNNDTDWPLKRELKPVQVL